MRNAPMGTVAFMLASLLATVSWAADQALLGNTLVVQDPKPGVDPTARKVVLTAKERNSPNPLVGDPALDGGGAQLTVQLNGTTPASRSSICRRG